MSLTKEENYIQREIAISLLSEQLLYGNKFSMVIISDSMYPFIKKGNQIEIRAIPQKGLRRGDIVVYNANDDLIAHRFLGWLRKGAEKHLITKGDNFARFDKPVSIASVLGRVTSIENSNGKILLGTRKWQNINAVLAIVSRFEGNFYQLYRTLKRNLKIKSIKPVFREYFLSIFSVCFKIVLKTAGNIS
jgi:signal peptidase I